MCVLLAHRRGFCFLFKQKTAYERRISDWSSDVCSSYLCAGQARGLLGECVADQLDPLGRLLRGPGQFLRLELQGLPVVSELHSRLEIGRASCRERVCQ